MGLNDLSLIVPAILTAFFIAFISMPGILSFADLKKKLDSNSLEKREKGRRYTPKLGGFGILLAFILSFAIWGRSFEIASFPYFIASLFILSLTFIRDEPFVITGIKKLFVQITAAIMLVIGGGLVMTDFSGLLGLEQISWTAGVVFSTLFIVMIVNGFNLIDGIDGLAGGIGMVVTGVLGIWFWGAGFLGLALLSFVLSGALIGFLIFNMHPAKIYMGNTGAMVLGFILAFLTLEFLTLNASLAGQGWYLSNAPVFALAILIVPIMDTLRVVLVRCFQGKNPFVNNRNHIHHKLIEIGMPEHYASFSLWLVNLLIIGVAYTISFLDIHLQLAVVLLCGTFMLPSIRFIYHIGLRLTSEKRDRKPAAVYEIH